MKIPVLERSVQSEPFRPSYIQADASPDAMGAVLAESVQRGTHRLGEAFTREVESQAAIRVTQAMDQLYKRQDALLQDAKSRRLDGAIGVAEVLGGDIDKFHSELRSNLPSDAARMAFDAQSGQTLRNTKDMLVRYELEQVDALDDSVTKSTLAQALNSMAAGGGDPKVNEDVIATINGTIDSRRARGKISEEEAALLKKQTISAGHAAVVAGRIDRDPVAARKYLDDHRAQMAETDVQAAMNKLAVADQKVRTQLAGDSYYVAAGGTPEGLQSAMAQVLADREAGRVDAQDVPGIEARIRERSSVDLTARGIQHDSLRQRLDAELAVNGGFSGRVSASLKAEILEKAPHLWLYAKEKERQIQNPEATPYTLAGAKIYDSWMTATPEYQIATDPVPVMLGKGVPQRLIDRAVEQRITMIENSRGLKNGVPVTRKVDRLTQGNLKTILDAAFRAQGWDKQGLTGKSKLDILEADVFAQMDQFEETKKRPPDRAEVESMVWEALRWGEVKGAGVLGLVDPDKQAFQARGDTRWQPDVAIESTDIPPEELSQIDEYLEKANKPLTWENRIRAKQALAALQTAEEQGQ